MDCEVKEIDNGYAVPGSDEDPGWVTFKCALCGAVLDYTPRKICFKVALFYSLADEDVPAEWGIPNLYIIPHRSPEQHPPVEGICEQPARRLGVRRADGYPLLTANATALPELAGSVILPSGVFEGMRDIIEGRVVSDEEVRGIRTPLASDSVS